MALPSWLTLTTQIASCPHDPRQTRISLAYRASLILVLSLILVPRASVRETWSRSSQAR